MAKITWITEDGNETIVDVKDGLNLMEAATANNIPQIEGECGGCLSCATCHVFVEESWLEKTGAVDDIEDTMLEMTDVERQNNSRLSCQIIASPALDGLILYVPEPE
ncbi:MAG: 2Fe-2S iron-sulfur cluster-binding protein [Gammaproteobacteria bacterium]|nr:2Fe-2S iron-sulfur cluster-binding protein [Gammaproteobacteria bacterium]MCZ6667306.1 2Fe-2S iron-sulfur cluster-binding protein [Gammaproteobacteria bacterium]MCZ6797972.1 2Fe-2S iron-sulfur cluster-binding protein [Gammaproteobacteria bacterium]